MGHCMFRQDYFEDIFYKFFYKSHNVEKYSTHTNSCQHMFLIKKSFFTKKGSRNNFSAPQTDKTLFLLPIKLLVHV